MASREIAEAGVRGRDDPDKSSAGENIPRGPQLSSDAEGGDRGVRMSNGVHTRITEAQIHTSTEDTDSIHRLPMSNGVHVMTTRFKSRTSTDDRDSRLFPPRRQEIYIRLHSHNFSASSSSYAAFFASSSAFA